MVATCPSKLTRYALCSLYHALAINWIPNVYFILFFLQHLAHEKIPIW
jgi:hypothetical protein